MAPPQGLSNSIHAPKAPVNVLNSINGGPAHSNDATKPIFRFGTNAQPSATDPRTSQALVKHDNEAATIDVPSRGQNSNRGDRRPEELRLAPLFLVHNASFTPDFSIDNVLLKHTGDGTSFSLDTLAAGIAQQCSVLALRHYLDAYPREEVGMEINAWIRGRHPILFYSAERNDVDCVRLLIEYGCDVCRLDIDDVPVLGFAIMRTKFTLRNPVEVVKALIAFGADPRSIPKDMWMNYIETPPLISSDEAAEDLDLPAFWCTKIHRKMLQSTLNLSVRYFLHKAVQLVATKGRAVQFAEAFGYTGLLKAPYHIIGQRYATQLVVNKLSAHIGTGRQMPLVLTFAGLSGHGKTELAKQMGSLLGVSMSVIDCAQMHSDMALFGSRPGYVGCERGSQLNNHLASCSGQRNVVFLDEFDKTDKQVHNSLLLLLDSGEYHDRRTNNPIDARKTIWILTTNLGDRAIEEFYEDHLEGLDAAKRLEIENKKCKILIDSLKRLFKAKFGAPITGRMKAVAPFFPFGKEEQAVIVHKFLMEMVDEVRHDIDLTPNVKRYLGHVHLAIKNDGKLCQHLTDNYIRELGARSLISAIDDLRGELFTSHVDTDELVNAEMNKGPLMRYTVQLKPVASGEIDGAMESEVSVVKDGHATYDKGQADNEDRDEEMTDVDKLNVAFANMNGRNDVAKHDELRT